MLDLLESFLPVIMGKEKHQKLIEATTTTTTHGAEDDPIPDDIQKELETAANECTTTYQDDNYVNPLIWAKAESERKGLTRILEQQETTSILKDALWDPCQMWILPLLVRCLLHFYHSMATKMTKIAQ
jgi:hypothetical protein